MNCKLCNSDDIYPGRNICRACRLSDLKAYRIEFIEPEETNAYMARYRAENRGSYNEYHKEYMRRRRENAKNML